MKTFKATTHINCRGVHVPTLYIGFVGKKRSGKDTAASAMESYIKDKSLCAVSTCSFAESLKELVADAFGIDVDIIEFAKTTEVGRFILQTVGVEWRRRHGDNVWIDRLNKKFHSWIDLINSRQIVVVIVSDVRFENEAWWIKDHGGMLIRMLRSETDSSGDKHVSETELENIECDYVISNDENLETLKHKIESFTETLILPTIVETR